VIQLLIFLHVLSVATWLGATLWVAGDVRRTLGLGKPFVTALPARVASALRLDHYAGAATVLTGLALIAYQEMSMRRHPTVGIVIGLVLALARLGLSGAALGPAWRKLAARIAAGDEVPATDPAVKRLGMLSGIGHALWVLALVTMVGGF
jgi:hypothetical protein